MKLSNILFLLPLPALAVPTVPFRGRDNKPMPPCGKDCAWPTKDDYEFASNEACTSLINMFSSGPDYMVLNYGDRHYTQAIPISCPRDGKMTFGFDFTISTPRIRYKHIGMDGKNCTEYFSGEDHWVEQPYNNLCHTDDNTVLVRAWDLTVYPGTGWAESNFMFRGPLLAVLLKAVFSLAVPLYLLML